MNGAESDPFAAPAGGRARMSVWYAIGSAAEVAIVVLHATGSLEFRGAPGVVSLVQDGGHSVEGRSNAALGEGVYLFEATIEWGGDDPAASLLIGPVTTVGGESMTLVGVTVVEATGWAPAAKTIRFTEFGCPALDRGTNQPNVFYDPKSSESALPYFSRGWRDEAIQRAYFEAVLGYWGDPANNPAATLYSGRMIDMDNSAAWTWDARPYPFFPLLEDVWSDGDNWRLGHWLSGRMGSVGLRELVRHLCRAGGMSDDEFDVSDLYGAVEGYAITAMESPRVSIEMLMGHFGFDAVESQGRVVFRPRGSAPVASLGVADLVAQDQGDVIELQRAQETELAQALKWSVLSSDEDYETVQVEARRVTVEAARIVSTSFPMAVPAEECERRARRALQEQWVGRETGMFRLPPSRLALDPADVVSLAHDGRNYEFRLVRVADNEGRDVEAARHDRFAFDLPPGPPRTGGTVAVAEVYGAGIFEFLDLPQIFDQQLDYWPLLAVHAQPWPGTMAIYRSAGGDGFALLTRAAMPVQMGLTTAEFRAGPVGRFDLAGTLEVAFARGTAESVTDLQLFAGANAFAVDTPAGWEIVQAGIADLQPEGHYRLSRLLRGQRDTGDAMVAALPAGARVVRLSDNLTWLPVAESEIGLEYNWRIGPASKAVTSDAFAQATFAPQARGRRPFAPVHVAQPWRQGRTPGDLTISWIRQSRSLAADNWQLAEVPLAEESEAYRVEILDGTEVVRTLESVTTSVVYSEAAQVADFGAALGPGDTLDIRVMQVSSSYGPGRAADVTLQF